MNTRYKLVSVCSTSVELENPSVETRMNFAKTARGEGRNSGFISPVSVTTTHSRSSTITVTVLIKVFLP